ncbi:MAG: thiamine phosphate synthase [Synergistaceae bacterium]|jgi:thiamine-phosphate pyrophosphorylase|nr:thiamine phosphate synthase [Synergistaceae bacterium]
MWDRENLRRALRLYVIPDRVIGAPLSLEEQARLALDGGATAIQLRDKSMNGGELLKTAKALATLCRERGALFIVNDRLDVALLSDADGVHLGQDDLPVTEARRLAVAAQGLSYPFVIGASVHTACEAKEAEGAGADYLGVGAVFGTGSKGDVTIIGVEGCREAVKETLLPSAAIGGISLDNLAEVMSAGVDGVSVISAVVRGDVRERAAAMKKALIQLAR